MLVLILGRRRLFAEFRRDFTVKGVRGLKKHEQDE